MKALLSNKANFNNVKLIDAPTQPTGDGQIKLRIEQFSFTANNITYAVLGDFLKYWSFFPACDQNGEDVSADWGQIPVWGFASVTESHCPDVHIGERFFGYFPPATECVLTPSKVTSHSFMEVSEHRLGLPASYNVYRAASHANQQADQEYSLFYPLFVTAYCIHDMLAEQHWYAAEQVLIISASSKTSIGVAYAMHSDESAPQRVGLTSQRNLNTVKALDLYDSVIDYDDIISIDATKPTLIIDMSGNKTLLSALHQRLGAQMVYTLNVGITHWGNLNEVDGIIEERTTQFFAPSHIQSMIKRNGPQAFQIESGKFVVESAIKTRNWLQWTELRSLEQLQQQYQAVCQGQLDAATGLIVTLP